MNGQEQEDEVFEGASSAEYWMYDSRTGRRFENDPLVYEYQSPYVCFNNNPIYFADPLGLEGEGGGDGGKSAGASAPTSGESGERGRGEGASPESSGSTKGDRGSYGSVRSGGGNLSRPSGGKSSGGSSGSGDLAKGGGNKNGSGNDKKGGSKAGKTPSTIRYEENLKITKAFYHHGGDGSGSFKDNSMKVLNVIRDFSPLTQLNDALNIALWGKDSRGIPKNGVDATYSVFSAIPFVGAEVNVGKNILKSAIKKTKPRAFWSGPGSEQRAINAGFATLGGTKAGKNLAKLTKDMPYYPGSQAYEMWGRLSKVYAKGAKGNVHVFQNATEGVGLKSIWKIYEYPALRDNTSVKNIIFH